MIDVDITSQRGTFTLQAKFAVPAKGITCLCGPSGAGKTSLLRALAGLDRARGCIRVNGDSWLSEQHHLPVHERQVGYVFQEASLFPHLNVLANLRYGYERRENRDDGPDMADVINLLRLGPLLERHSDELSGGEQQRVAIGRALLANPRLLLMDEPLASLDAGHKRELLPYLERLHNELRIPVVYVSHATDEVARLADHIVLFNKGRTVAHGEAADMLTRLDLPLTHGDDAAAIITANPESYDAEFNLTRMSFSGGELLIPDNQIGEMTTGNGTQRVRIMARDVSIALEQPVASSILNIVPAEIAELAIEGNAQCIIKIRAGNDMLLARVTRKSVHALNLQPGKKVYAQIKSAALLG